MWMILNLDLILADDLIQEVKNGGVTLRFKVEVAFMNDKIPTFFQRRPVYVCCLTETSDGRMVDFRRTGASKLQERLEIDLYAELTSVEQFIVSHVMCDDIGKIVLPYFGFLLTIIKLERGGWLSSDLSFRLCRLLLCEEGIPLQRMQVSQRQTYLIQASERWLVAVARRNLTEMRKFMFKNGSWTQAKQRACLTQMFQQWPEILPNPAETSTILTSMAMICS
jgi:hypothetical protein